MGLGPAVVASMLSTPLFADVTTAMNAGFAHQATYLSMGQAFADVDGDGWPDLIFTSNDGENGILLNDQGNGFSTAPYADDIRVPGHPCGGLAIADYDNDGRPDIYMTGNGGNHLFRNQAGTGFADVTATAGVGHGGRDESAAWADFNGDGWLDLVVAGWPLAGSDAPAEPVNRDALYFNNGDGTFTDLTTMLDHEASSRPGFAVGALDFDHDGDPDIYVVNDREHGNTLWRNDGPGCGGWCFTDVSMATGTFRPVYGMGLSVADFDNDLDDDLLFSSIGEQVLLSSQWSQGAATYAEVSATAGVDLDVYGWATILADFDNDGWKDAFIATFGSESDNADRVLLNKRDGTFLDISAASGASGLQPSIGAARGDFDRDGRLDPGNL